MQAITRNRICELSQNPKNIRNASIIAHVDHGKTSLADHLLSNNGIISPKNAGITRYLDYRQDERERRITMKTSVISLIFKKKSQNQSNNVLNCIL